MFMRIDEKRDSFVFDISSGDGTLVFKRERSVRRVVRSVHEIMVEMEYFLLTFWTTDSEGLSLEFKGKRSVFHGFSGNGTFIVERKRG